VKDCRDKITGLLEEQKKVTIKELLLSSNEDEIRRGRRKMKDLAWAQRKRDAMPRDLLLSSSVEEEN
jgi:hypothetical protein